MSKVIKYDVFRVYSQYLLFYAPTNNNQTTSRKVDSEIPFFVKVSIQKKSLILCWNKFKTKQKHRRRLPNCTVFLKPLYTIGLKNIGNNEYKL